MSREVELALLSDVEVARSVARYAPGFFMAKVVAYADEFSKQSGDGECDAIALAMLPVVLLRNAMTSTPAARVVEDLLAECAGHIESLDLAKEVYAAEQEAAAEQAAADEEAAIKAQLAEEQRIADEAAAVEARRVAAVEADKQRKKDEAEAEKVRQAEMKQREESRKAAEAEAEANRDAENADSETADSDEDADDELTQAQLDSLLIDECGFSEGIANDITAYGIETFAELMVLKETAGYETISGIGEKSVPKIDAVVEALQARVKG